MPHKTDSSNPKDWILFAESDLVGVAHLVQQEISYHMCCSKLAEILEKILKAELIRLGWFLVKTHDLQKLADELQARNSDVGSEAQELAEEQLRPTSQIDILGLTLETRTGRI